MVWRKRDRSPVGRGDEVAAWQRDIASTILNGICTSTMPIDVSDPDRPLLVFHVPPPHRVFVDQLEKVSAYLDLRTAASSITISWSVGHHAILVHCCMRVRQAKSARLGDAPASLSPPLNCTPTGFADTVSAVVQTALHAKERMLLAVMWECGALSDEDVPNSKVEEVVTHVHDKPHYVTTLRCRRPMPLTAVTKVCQTASCAWIAWDNGRLALSLRSAPV